MNSPTRPVKKMQVLSLLSLYMVILLDVAGLILVMPVLTPLILSADSVIIPSGTSLLYRDFLYGFSLALFPLFMFFSTPILGDLSDRVGRKNILLLCLIMSAISYAIAAIGIIYGSLFVLLFSRALAGLSAGTQPIATAAIIDVSMPENKSKNLAWIVFTSSLGLILGPIIGGITADKNVVTWFSYETPFIFSAALSLLNAIFLSFFFQETIFLQKKHEIQLTKGLTLFFSAFSRSAFRLLSFFYFCFVLAWSLYYQTINWFFLDKYHYSVGKLGLFVAFIGVVFSLSSIMMRFILRLFASELDVFVFFILMMGIANGAAAMATSELAQWLWVILNAMSDVVCFTVGLSIFSNLVSEKEQGWMMGVAGAIGALTWTVGGLIAGPLGYLDIRVPLWSACFLCLLSFMFAFIYRKQLLVMAKGTEEQT